MDIFLRAKPWQLFLLTVGIPIITEIALIGNMMAKILQNPYAVPDPRVMMGYFKIFPFVMILFMAALLGWQYSVATGLQKMLPAVTKMKVKKFRIFFFIPVVYLSLLMGFLFYILSFNFFDLQNLDSIAPGIFIAFAIIFPLHLFSIFCLFYCMYFVAKTIKTVELQREVLFNDFIAEFFLTWFFPIGVWILQPRINKMIKQYSDELSGVYPANNDQVL